ncbi:MAG: TIGR04076 family protein [Mogibacterium sp.]|nr:TIGR04076 family protein [Mogibacterium sp.]
MRKVKLTVTESDCRSDYFKEGQVFIVGDLCPPLCHELWNVVYPYVFALQNGADLDCGDGRRTAFDAACPDGQRVRVHGEVVEE